MDILILQWSRRKNTDWMGNWRQHMGTALFEETMFCTFHHKNENKCSFAALDKSWKSQWSRPLSMMIERSCWRKVPLNMNEKLRCIGAILSFLFLFSVYVLLVAPFPSGSKAQFQTLLFVRILLLRNSNRFSIERAEPIAIVLSRSSFHLHLSFDKIFQFSVVVVNFCFWSWLRRFDYSVFEFRVWLWKLRIDGL